MIDDLITRLPDILTILTVVVAVPLNWYVTYRLWQASMEDPGGAALRVMAVLSTCVALIVTVFALVFVNNGLDNPALTPRETMVLTRGALLILSVVPAVYWIRWYRRKEG